MLYEGDPGGDNILLIVVSIDPQRAQHGFVEAPFEEFGFLPRGDAYTVHDLLSDERYEWHGRRNFVALDPHQRPAQILRLER